MKKLFCLILACVPVAAQAADYFDESLGGGRQSWTVQTNKQSDVQTLINASTTHNGDTIKLLPGEETWTTQLLVNKAVKIEGASGAQKTIINDSSAANTSLVMIKDVVITPLPSPAPYTRLTGITFQRGTSKGKSIYDGMIHVDGTNTSGWRCRIDHNSFINIMGCVLSEQTMIGVFDHNTIRGGVSDCNPDPVPAGFVAEGCGTKTYHRSDGWDNDKTDGFNPLGSDASWASSSDYGGINCFVGEDNIMDYSQGGGGTWSDGKWGGRVVWRRNAIHHGVANGAIFTHHGTEELNSASRHVEIYSNNIVSTAGGLILNQRAGTGVVFNNRCLAVTGGHNNLNVELTTDRNSDPSFWGMASGRNPWDENDTGAGGTNANPTAFYTGNVETTVVGGARKVVLSASAIPGWTTNKWRGYSLRNLDELNTNNSWADGADKNVGGTIESSDDRSVTLEPRVFAKVGQTRNVYNAGQNVKIWRVKNSKNQCGRAGIDKFNLLERGGTLSPILHEERGFGNRETNEPWFMWNNSTGPSFTPMGIQVSSVLFRKCSGTMPFGSDPQGCHYWDNNLPQPGYPYTPGVDAKIGTDYTGALSGPWALQTVTGLGEYAGCYPHPLVTQADCGAAAAAQITSTLATFSTDAAAQEFQVETSNFTTSPTFALSDIVAPSGATPGALPNDVAFSTGGKFSGSAATAVVGDYKMTITATAGAQTAEKKGFVVRVSAPNGAPVISTFTAVPSQSMEPADIVLKASASDDGSITKVEFFRNDDASGTPIGTATTGPPYTYTDTARSAGTYDYTAKAFDNATPALTSTKSVTDVVILSGPTETPTPAVIYIKP